MKTTNHTQKPGFTFIELLIVIGVVVVCMAIFFPFVGNERQKAWRISCTGRVKQIGLANKTWAIDHNDLFPAQYFTNSPGPLSSASFTNVAVYFSVMSNELSTAVVLACPADAQTVPVSAFSQLSPSNVSYFVGLEASDSMPNMFLSGDRNLTNHLRITNSVLFITTNRPVGWTHKIHRLQGNIGLADGSVQQFSNSRLAEAASVSARLLMP